MKISKSFRPLSGNYISQRTNVDYATMYIVSVPCRGTTFLKVYQRTSVRTVLVSVPCRGTTFLKIN